jgi:hypothetical protein
MTQATNHDTVTHEIGEHGRLHLRVADASVRVRATGGTSARVSDTAGHDLTELYAIERLPGELSVRSREGVFGLMFGFRRGSALEVELPSGASVTVESASGDVSVRGVLGEQRYRTASGEIRLTDVGGSLSIDAVSGDVDVRAAAAVALEARTVSGDLEVHAPTLLSAAITTTSGDAELDANVVAGARYSIQTVSGDALVRTDGGLRVEGRTMTGSIRTEDGQRAEGRGGTSVLVVGDGSATLTFRSLSGGLRVARGTAPQVPMPPSPPEPPAPAGPELAPPAEAIDDDRMEILRALERGEIDVATASSRIATLEASRDE